MNFYHHLCQFSFSNQLYVCLYRQFEGSTCQLFLWFFPILYLDQILSILANYFPLKFRSKDFHANFCRNLHTLQAQPNLFTLSLVHFSIYHSFISSLPISISAFVWFLHFFLSSISNPFAFGWSTPIQTPILFCLTYFNFN